MYYSNYSNQYVFISEPVYADGLVKSDGTIDTNTYQSTTLSSPVVVGQTSQTTVEGAINSLALQSFYLEQTVTLSTSADTTVTFTDAKITTSSCIEVGTSVWGIVPSDVTVTTGVCTVTLPKADSAQSIIVRIYVR